MSRMISLENIQPLVSVLVTTFNQEEYISRTLESILTQECSFCFEVIVGEDCSTDRTRAICEEYREKYPDKMVLCLNKQNKGLIKNYFDIFLKARGKYLADCGGDDYWLSPHKLQQQVDLLEKYPQVSMIAGNWSVLLQKNGKISPNQAYLETDWFQPECFGKKAVMSYLNDRSIPRVVLSTSCFRKKEALEAYRLKPELFRSEAIACEDLPLTLCLLMKGPIYFSKENWLMYRVLENSISHHENEDLYMDGFAFRTFKQTINLAEGLGIKPAEISVYVDRWIPDFALHAFLAGNRKLMNGLRRFIREKSLHFRFKQQILSYCMSIPFIYRFTRWLYLKQKHSSLNS